MILCDTFRNNTKQCPNTVSVFGEALYVAVMAGRCISPHYPSAYVWFIYIHGYPDNEAFNPGDPAVRTMNPITSCRLWDGMVQSQTDGRGCSRPAIQSYSSRSCPCFPLSTGSAGTYQQTEGTWDHYIVGQQFCKRSYARSPSSHSRPQCSPRPLTHLRFISSLLSDAKSSDTRWESGPGTTCKGTDARISKPSRLFFMIYLEQSRFTF